METGGSIVVDNRSNYRVAVVLTESSLVGGFKNNNKDVVAGKSETFSFRNQGTWVLITVNGSDTKTDPKEASGLGGRIYYLTGGERETIKVTNK
jgi:hypothetical protein